MLIKMELIVSFPLTVWFDFHSACCNNRQLFWLNNAAKQGRMPWICYCRLSSWTGVFDSKLNSINWCIIGRGHQRLRNLKLVLNWYFQFSWIFKLAVDSVWSVVKIEEYCRAARALLSFKLTTLSRPTERMVLLIRYLCTSKSAPRG